MGHWSESCSLSGMRIPANELCYVIGIGRPITIPGDSWDFRVSITVPPLKGRYDEYGRIELEEGSKIFGYQAGDLIDIVDTDFVLLHAGVVDRLVEIPMDFPYVYWSDENNKSQSKKVEDGTLGSWLMAQIAIDRNSVQAVMNHHEDMKADIAVDNAMALASLDSMLDYHLVHLINDYIMAGSKKTFKQVAGHPELHDEFWELYSRCLLLRAAESETRQRIKPHVSGPQDAGEDALFAYSKIVLEECDKQRKDHSAHES